MKKALLLSAFLLLLFGCAALAEPGLKVVAANFPCYDFARQLLGDAGEVSMLIRPGVEVHSFEPTPADILSVSDADLFVYIGGEGDAWADDMLSGLEGQGPARILTWRLLPRVLCDADHARHRRLARGVLALASARVRGGRRERQSAGVAFVHDRGTAPS